MMKILVVTKNWLGDILFQYPAIEAIQKNYPKAEISCMSPARCREILEANPAISRVLIFDEKNEQRSFVSRFSLASKLRSEKWDQVYLLHRSRTRAFLAWVSGAKERIGYAHQRSFFLTKAIQTPRQPMHHVDYFLYLLKEAGLAVEYGVPYKFYVSESAKRSASIVLINNNLTPKSFIVFHLGANWEPKRWPVSHFAELADMIWKKWEITIVLTGAASDLPLVHEFIRRTQHARVVSLIAQTNLEELGVIFSHAICLVTGDSGPMHIASGIGTPVAAIFGPTDPELTGPRGIGKKVILRYVPPGCSVPWYGNKMPPGGWLSNISPAEVLKSIESQHWIARDSQPSEPAVVSKAPLGYLDSQKSNVMNILLVTLSNIGDVILTTPVIMALKSKFPHSFLTVVTGRRASGVLEGSKFIDHLIIYDKRGKFRQQWGFLMELRKRSYDWVVDLRNTAIPWLVRSKKRSPLFRLLKSVSMRDRHLEVLKKMGIDDPAPPSFDFYDFRDEGSLFEKLKAKGIAAQKKWILVAPIAASQLKTWSLDGFKRVIERFLCEHEENIFIVGDQRERALSNSLVNLNPERIHNLSGEITLRELAVLVSRAVLLLTNDSAVMHLGYELNRPVVAVFGPTHHEKYGHEGPNFKIVRAEAFCAPCEESVCRFDKQICMQTLDAQKVYLACKGFLHANLSSV